MFMPGNQSPQGSQPGQIMDYGNIFQSADLDEETMNQVQFFQKIEEMKYLQRKLKRPQLEVLKTKEFNLDKI